MYEACSVPLPYMLQEGLTSKLSELQRVHIGGEGEDVYEAHSELLILDGKLPWGSDALLHGGYVLF